MKIQHLLLCAAVCSLTSCFKEEPLNAECDIEQAYVHTDDPTDIFFAASDTLVNVLSDATEVVFEIKEGADVSAMAPVFNITEGATVEPASGSTHDFSNGKAVAYTVTSQDGRWKKTYNVSFKAVYPVSEYDFENYYLVKGPNRGEIYEWSDLAADGSPLNNWATGNPGFNISMGSAAPDEYPTTPVEGHSGMGVKLETKDTGIFGFSMSMGIAAGNLFIGEFDVQPAISGGAEGAMRATLFGRPFDRQPLQFTGWYKYKSGGECIDGDMNPIPGTYDQGDIYAVLYRNHDDEGNPFVLHGDDVLNSPQIVAVARVPEVTDVDEWTEFNINFEYSEDIDPQLLADRGYNLTVVFTSSIEGATFKGAVGSTLHVDEVKVICAETTE